MERQKTKTGYLNYDYLNFSIDIVLISPKQNQTTFYFIDWGEMKQRRLVAQTGKFQMETV